MVHGAVGAAERWAVDLALQYPDLAAEGEDLGVAGVAGREEPSQSADHGPCEGAEQGHGAARYRPPDRPETPGNSARTGI